MQLTVDTLPSQSIVYLDYLLTTVGDPTALYYVVRFGFFYKRLPVFLFDLYVCIDKQ